MRKSHRQLVGIALIIILLTSAFTIIGCSSTLTITTTSLPDGRVGAGYCGVFVKAKGGTLPYEWSSPTTGSGAFPAGLGFCVDPVSGDSSTPMINGIPEDTGTTTVSLKVTDNDGHVATRNLSITIKPQPVTGDQAVKIASGNLPAEVVERAKVRLEYQPSYSRGEEGVWLVHFDNANVTHNELHWPIDQSSIGPEDVLNTVVIEIRAETGEVVGRIAANDPAFSFPGPSSMCGCETIAQ